MSTKLKTIPLPAGLAPLPKKEVFLGKGPLKTSRVFTGRTVDHDAGQKEWASQSSGLNGKSSILYYAAPRDSAIAREILGVKDEPKETPFRSDPVNRSGERKPKKSAKKAPTLRKLPKNVKPGTRVVCVKAANSDLKKGVSYTVSDSTHDSVQLKEQGAHWMWSERFRLAPEKKRVQRTKKIGVMPALEVVRDEKAADITTAAPVMTKEELEEFWRIKGEEMCRNSAVGLLNEAAETIGARAAERDVDSERSMAKCVAAFNVMFGKYITEEQGWRFMELLKMSRSTVGKKRDDYLDGAAYCALAGEAANAKGDSQSPGK